MANTSEHTHERSCIVCGAKHSKRDMLRIVRTAKGGVAFDPTGRMPGRGAYVCSSECFETLNPGRVSRALKANVSTEDIMAIKGALGTQVSSAQG